MPRGVSSKNKKKKREQNDANELTKSISEQILDSIKDFYVSPGSGLETIAEAVKSEGMPKIIYPRNKVSVMIIGNHSAGKSSFVNWYVDENVRDTGVAIESKGFTIITYGKRASEPIQGEGCLKYWPHLKGLKQLKSSQGLMNHLVCISSVSQSRSFPMVDFVDTPGLVDGGMEYGFDVNDAILEIANHVDLIFVFMDPVGSATCSRTMDVVELLNKHDELHHKCRYYLTKVDTVDSMTDLLKVSGQLTQILGQKIRHTHGWEVFNIFLPNPDVSPEFAKLNQISTKLCVDIDKQIQTKVQKNLDRLKSDSETLMARIKQALQRETDMKSSHGSKRCRGHLFGLCAWLIVPLIAFMFTLHRTKEFFPAELAGHEHVLMMEKPALRFFELFPDVAMPHIAAAHGVVFLMLLIFKKLYHSSASQYKMRTFAEIKALKKHHRTLKAVIQQRDKMHDDFMANTVNMDG